MPFISEANPVYVFLNGQHGLSIEMIRNLHRHLGIPAASLIGV